MSAWQKKQNELRVLAKEVSKLSPERIKQLENSSTPESFDPPLPQMHFGGAYNFDVNRKQVELEGEFSKQDLIQIALMMD